VGVIDMSLSQNNSLSTLRPCQYRVPDTGIVWTFTAVPTMKEMSFRVQMDVYFVKSGGTTNTFDSYVVGPGDTYRDFYFDVTGDDFLNQLQIKSPNSVQIAPIFFDEIVVTSGHCWSKNAEVKWRINGRALYDTLNDGSAGLTDIKDLTPGRWWVSYHMTPSRGPAWIPPNEAVKWTLHTDLLQTCSIQCLEHGKCVEIPAYCLCNTWWDGPDCQAVFKGAYVLLGWATIFLAAAVIFLGRAVWQNLRLGMPKVVQTNGHEYSSSDEEVKEETDPMFLSSKFSSNVTRRNNGLTRSQE